HPAAEPDWRDRHGDGAARAPAGHAEHDHLQPTGLASADAVSPTAAARGLHGVPVARLADRRGPRDPRVRLPHVPAVRRIDVVGPPGVGKSTLCDRDWPPEAIRWNGEQYPSEWGAFLECAWGLLRRVRTHPTYSACESMMHRSFRKMAA